MHFSGSKNWGGYSLLNLWNPQVIQTAPHYEEFSLAQQWYSGGSGCQHQTAEVGWQRDPRYYSTDKSVLFIYWTASNYGMSPDNGKTKCPNSGCYNLCKYDGKHLAFMPFMLLNNDVALGSTVCHTIFRLQPTRGHSIRDRAWFLLLSAQLVARGWRAMGRILP